MINVERFEGQRDVGPGSGSRPGSTWPNSRGASAIAAIQPEESINLPRRLRRESDLRGMPKKKAGPFFSGPLASGGAVPPPAAPPPPRARKVNPPRKGPINREAPIGKR